MSEPVVISRKLLILAAVVISSLLIAAVAVGLLLGGTDSSGSATADTKVATHSGMHTITGSVTVTDLAGAIPALTGGYAGQSFDELSLAQLSRGQRFLSRLKTGETFDCPDGVGGGYDDLRVGAQVVVSDGSGKVLATSNLTGGVLSSDGCTFTYSAEVADADFYSVDVTHRGALTYSRAELENANWEVDSEI